MTLTLTETAPQAIDYRVSETAARELYGDVARPDRYDWDATLPRLLAVLRDELQRRWPAASVAVTLDDVSPEDSVATAPASAAVASTVEAFLGLADGDPGALFGRVLAREAEWAVTAHGG